MKRRILDFVLYGMIVLVSVGASLLFTYLPFKALDTGIVYGGF